jgi:hypothetical protein
MTPSPSPSGPVPPGDGFVDFVGSLASFWTPFFLFLIAFFVLRTPKLVRALTSKVRRVSAFGMEFEFNEEGAQATRLTVEEGFRAIREALTREIDVAVDARFLGEKLEQSLARILPIPKDLGGPGSDPNVTTRCTLHIPDLLLRHYLYQLFDYYPDGGGKGRSFSIRVGLLGRVWRFGESEVASETVRDPRDLVKEWGLTIKEANASSAKGKNAFLAVCLKDEKGTPVGVLYMDSSSPNAFGDSAHKDEVIERVQEACRETSLTQGLADLLKEMRTKGPQVDVDAP